MTNYSIGNRIRILRTQFHLSQEQLALRAGITTAYLGQIEREEKNPTVKLVEKISNVFNLSLSELFSDHEIVSKNDEAKLSGENKAVSKKEDNVIDCIAFEISSLSEKEKTEILEIVRQIIKFKFT